MNLDGSLFVVEFNFYVKHVLPSEWIASWDDDSLLAGAIAVKMYAWWHATTIHHKDSGAFCYDVSGDDFHQVYNPDFSTMETNQAVDATWEVLMVDADEGDALEGRHDLGPGDGCGDYNGGDAPGYAMSQEGSHACAEAGMSWQEVLSEYYFAPDGAWIKQLTFTDTDGDGCDAWHELGANERRGGRRSPLNPYDFYDTNGDKYVNLTQDILGVILRWTPAPSAPYDAAYDRGPSGGSAWDLTAPDGTINLTIDILGVIAQWQHDCR